MECFKCKKEIKQGEKYFTFAGMIQCKECDDKAGGTISLDSILRKIINDKKMNKQQMMKEAESIIKTCVNNLRKIGITDEEEQIQMFTETATLGKILEEKED